MPQSSHTSHRLHRSPPLVIAAQLTLAPALLVSCKPSGATRATQAEAPVAAPDALFGEGTLRDPDAFWARIRSGAGGSFMSMPDTAAGVVVARAHLDPRLAHLVAGGLPFHVALGEAEGGGLAFALAMKLRDPESAEHALTAWDAGLAPSTTSAEAAPGTGSAGALEGAGGLRRIGSHADSSTSLPAALSSSGYLVVASSESDLATLGPYAARTLPTKPLATSSLELRAAPGALAQAGVKATNLGGRATSLLLTLARRVLPAAVDAGAFAACLNPTLRAQAATIADLAEAKVDIDTGDGELHAVATLSPKPGDNAARARLLAMHPADAAPLLDAPGDASYAWFVSDTQAQREDDASTLAPCLAQALGGPLGDDGAKTLGESLSAFAKGRGDWDTLALVSIPPANGLVLRAPVADGAAASHALGSLTDLVRLPPGGDAIQQIFGVQSGVVEHADVPGIAGAGATIVTFARLLPASAASPDKKLPSGARTPLSPPTPPGLGLAWAMDATEIDVSGGQSPKELLSYAREARKLGGDLATAQAVRALGSDASFAAVLKPFGCCVNGGPTATPLTFGWGRRGDAGWSRLEMGYDLLVRLIGQ